MKKKLAIIRACNSQIPYVEKAKEMSVETHCFSWDKEGFNHCKGIADFFHPISILEKEQILEKCKEIKIDGVISMSDNAMATVAFVAQGMGLIGNNYEDSLIAISKYSARQAYYKHNVGSPRFVLAQEGVDLTGLKYPLIVKPTDGRSAVGVIKVEEENDLQNAVKRARELSFIKEVIIEEFIDGVEVSVDTISWNGKHYILAIKDKEFAKTTEEFTLLAEHYPSQLSPEIQEKIKNETRKALDAINFKYGAAVTQFKVTDSGDVFSIEINPRMAGDFAYKKMELSYGYDYRKGAIDIALGQFEEPVFIHNKYSGQYFLHRETDWVRHVIENKNNDADIIDAKFYENDYYGDIKGYFIYQSEQKRRWEPAK